jgi:hypothetical protein
MQEKRAELPNLYLLEEAQMQCGQFSEQDLFNAIDKMFKEKF